MYLIGYMLNTYVNLEETANEIMWKLKFFHNL